MADFVNFLMFIACSIGSMAFGVLAAYGVLRVAFTLMRPRRRSTVIETQVHGARV
jgi:hypothetical protein